MYRYNRSLISISFAAGSFFLATILVLFPSFFTEAQTKRIPVALQASTSCTNGVPSVQLSWTNPNSAKDFIVYRNPNAAGAQSWGPVAQITPTSYTDIKVISGATYQYQVRAVSPSGAERYSDIVSVTPVPCAKLTFNPKISTQCSNGTPSVVLSWTNPNNAPLFSVFRNPNLNGVAAWEVIGKPTSPNYTDTAVKLSGTYQYQIQAISPEGNARYSDILQAQNLYCPSATTTPTTPPATTTPATSTPPTPTTLLWGAYSGWQESDMAQFESTLGESFDHMAAFTHWGNNNIFPAYMGKFTKDKGRTLIIFWEASNHNVYSTEQPAFSYDAILRGDWDAYIRSFAEQARIYGGPVILIPFSEMNGNWSPWSGVTNGNTPAKAVEGYRHVRRVFGDVPNVKFGWAPNSNSVPDTPENQLEKYYPGDAYVDYVGVDGFNFGDPWMTFDQIFSKPLAKLSLYNKPIYILSVASSAGAAKAEWITDAITTQMPKYPLLKGFNWFNQNKEKNWLIWSDNASLTAFKAAVQ